MRQRRLLLIPAILVLSVLSRVSTQTDRISFVEDYSYADLRGEIRALAWSQDQKLLAISVSTGQFGYLVIMDTETYAIVADHEIPDIPDLLSWSYDSQWLAAAESWARGHKRIWTWNASRRILTELREMPPVELLVLTFSPNALYLGYSDLSETLYVWDIEDNHLAAQLSGATAPTFASNFAWLPDGSGFSTIRDCGILTIYNVDDFTEASQTNYLDLASDMGFEFTGTLCSTVMSWSPQGKYFAVGLTRQILGIIDYDEQLAVGYFETKNRGGFELATGRITWLPGGDKLVVGTGVALPDGDIVGFDTGAVIDVVRNSVLPLDTPEGIDLFRGFFFSPHDEFIAGALFSLPGSQRDLENSVFVWGADDGLIVQELHSHEGLVKALAVSPDGNTIALGDSEGVVKLWKRR